MQCQTSFEVCLKVIALTCSLSPSLSPSLPLPLSLPPSFSELWKPFLCSYANHHPDLLDRSLASLVSPMQEEGHPVGEKRGLPEDTTPDSLRDKIRFHFPCSCWCCDQFSPPIQEIGCPVTWNLSPSRCQTNTCSRLHWNRFISGQEPDPGKRRRGKAGRRIEGKEGGGIEGKEGGRIEG